MPNRMLRDWTDSEKINSLSVQSERFFIRLIMKVDDYGCFSADTRLLKANLFPLLLDNIREADLLRWMAECQKAELIVLYENSKKKLLQIVDFKQRLDRAKSKYPLPQTLTHEPQVIITNPREVVNDYPHEEKRREVEREVEVDGAKAQHTDTQIIFFKKFTDWITDNAPRFHQFKEPFTIAEYLRIKNDFPIKTIETVLKSIQNRADVLKKNLSANLTFRNWAAREFETETLKIEPLNNLNEQLKAISKATATA